MIAIIRLMLTLLLLWLLINVAVGAEPRNIAVSSTVSGAEGGSDTGVDRPMRRVGIPESEGLPHGPVRQSCGPPGAVGRGSRPRRRDLVHSVRIFPTNLCTPLGLQTCCDFKGLSHLSTTPAPFWSHA